MEESRCRSRARDAQSSRPRARRRRSERPERRAPPGVGPACHDLTCGVSPVAAPGGLGICYCPEGRKRE
eukprot:969676-Prymnesium_polylepis.1